MKLEQNEKPLLFSETSIPDLFFSDYLSILPGDYLKIYLYITFLSKYGKDVRIHDLSKKLNLPLKTIQDSFKCLEDNRLLTKTTTGYIVNNLQELALHNLYTPSLALSKEKIENNAKNSARSKAIGHINNMYFQGIMSPSWYNDIDTWFSKFHFDEQVMIALFNYCYDKSALHKNYVQTVAEAWHSNKIQTWSDLEKYSSKQESLNIFKKTIAKKLGKQGRLTQYEEAYIENWVINYGYDMNIIEIALKRTTFKQSPSFEYLNNLISDWNERNLKTPEQVNAFIEQRNKQQKDTKELKSQVNKVSKSNYEQRNYDDLDFLYANTSNS